ncbi:EAL domain-containing response regulator [Metapseudomonas otitidis]|uniref:EAL domain-containing response regulator n=1 Tax=Metapseudomonas otitidis TaxID=319939 RepID=UPI003EE1AACC
MRSTRILIVEDQPFQREHLLNLFRELGVTQLSVAEDGREAARQLEGEPFDLVISDLMMPGLDGVQLIQRLAARKPRPWLVIMSAAPQRLVVSACMVARAYGLHVLEPVAKPARSALVRRLLDTLQAGIEQHEREAQARLSRPSLAELERALREEELQVWFQPRFSLLDGRIVAAKALQRWLHPRHGMLKPAAFMAELSQAGLDEVLLRGALRQAIASQRVWARQGACLKVLVGLPARLLADEALPDRLALFVAEQGGVPAKIVFEVQAEGQPPPMGPSYAGTCRLRLKGFGVALDDLVRGCGSLHDLLCMPCTELKIDRELLLACMADEGLAVTLQGLVAQARRVGLEVVAEGVEHGDELGVLRRLGCDSAQGYLFSEPVAPAVLVRLLRQEWLAARHCSMTPRF